MKFKTRKKWLSAVLACAMVVPMAGIGQLGLAAYTPNTGHSMILFDENAEIGEDLGKLNLTGGTETKAVEVKLAGATGTLANQTFYIAGANTVAKELYLFAKEALPGTETYTGAQSVLNSITSQNDLVTVATLPYTDGDQVYADSEMTFKINKSDYKPATDEMWLMDHENIKYTLTSGGAVSEGATASNPYLVYPVLTIDLTKVACAANVDGDGAAYTLFAKADEVTGNEGAAAKPVFATEVKMKSDKSEIESVVSVNGYGLAEGTKVCLARAAGGVAVSKTVAEGESTVSFTSADVAGGSIAQGDRIFTVKDGTATESLAVVGDDTTGCPTYYLEYTDKENPNESDWEPLDGAELNAPTTGEATANYTVRATIVDKGIYDGCGTIEQLYIYLKTEADKYEKTLTVTLERTAEYTDNSVSKPAIVDKGSTIKLSNYFSVLASATFQVAS